jgi:hypothetical protein
MLVVLNTTTFIRYAQDQTIGKPTDLWFTRRWEQKKTPRGLNRKIKVSLCLREETPNVIETRSKMDNPETLATMSTQTSR